MSTIQTIIGTPNFVNLIGHQYEEFIKVNRLHNLEGKGQDVFKQYATTLTVGAHTLDSVFWIPGLITYGRCRSHSDYISFDFSGCWMARLKSGEGDFALHISTDTYETRDKKKDFLSNLKTNIDSINDLSIFQPLCLYERHNSLQTMFFSTRDDCTERKVWGLITNNGECYSIIVDAQPASNIEYEVAHYTYSLYAIIKHPKYGKEILELPEVLSFLKTGKRYKEGCEELEGIWIENYKRLQYIYKAY